MTVDSSERSRPRLTKTRKKLLESIVSKGTVRGVRFSSFPTDGSRPTVEWLRQHLASEMFSMFPRCSPKTRLDLEALRKRIFFAEVDGTGSMKRNASTVLRKFPGVQSWIRLTSDERCPCGKALLAQCSAIGQRLTDGIGVDSQNRPVIGKPIPHTTLRHAVLAHAAEAAHRDPWPAMLPKMLDDAAAQGIEAARDPERTLFVSRMCPRNAPGSVLASVLTRALEAGLGDVRVVILNDFGRLSTEREFGEALAPAASHHSALDPDST